MTGFSQDLPDLIQCYSNIDVPVVIDESVVEGEPVEFAVVRLGAAARHGIHMPKLHDHVLRNLRHISSAASDQSLTELFWFLFSQKAWSKIEWLSRKFASRLPDLPVHLGDLCFLSFYRMQKDVLMAGSDRAGFHAAALPVLERIAKAWPEAERRLDIFEAMIGHVCGNIDPAREVFAQAGHVELIEPFAGVASVRRHAIETKDPDMGRVVIRPAAAEHVTLLSMDRNYFNKFAHLAAARYAQTNPRNGLHFHCIGFDPSEAIAGWKLAVPVGITIDSEDLGALTFRQQRGYFAAARHLYLSRYLDMYRSIFVADVDGHVWQDVREMSEEYAGSDVVMNTKVLDSTRQLKRLPWEAVSAGIFLIRDTSAGRQYARLLGQSLANVIDDGMRLGRPLWYSDQTVIFYTWLDTRDTVRFSSFSKAAFVQKGSWQLFEGDRDRMAFMTTAGASPG